jgi:hypothetical protein
VATARSMDDARIVRLHNPSDLAANAAPIASCLLCGHEQPLAVYREGTTTGVCSECRDLAAPNRGPCSPARDCACWHRSVYR